MGKHALVGHATPEDDADWIYRKSFRHHISGAIIVAPPGKCFRFRRRK